MNGIKAHVATAVCSVCDNHISYFGFCVITIGFSFILLESFFTVVQNNRNSEEKKICRKCSVAINRPINDKQYQSHAAVVATHKKKWLLLKD